ncbi:MAG TPA: hypothetical protein VFY87_02840 [Geminicoccaceae bacterium]|nr:hypothetical protein [Geminicoccaceae bacterium]
MARRDGALRSRHPATLMLGGLLRSGKLRTGLVFGLAALAFAGANLLLAHQMAPEAYGMVSLVVALTAVGSPLAPLGLAPIVVREHLPATPRLLGQCAATSALVAAVTAAVAAAVYGLPAVELGALVAAVVGGGFIRLAAAVLQSEERFVASTLASESMNYLLLLAAVGVFALGPAAPAWPLGFAAAAQLALAGGVWVRLLATEGRRDAAAAIGTPPWLAEMLLLTGVTGAAVILLQVERFAIPLFLDLETLAGFAVLAVFAIGPFRPVEVGTYRTLMPRLRRAASPKERRRALLREAAHTAAVLVPLGLALLVAIPVALALFFPGKYQFALGTVLAAVVGGQLRVARSVIAAALSALADRPGLAWWNAVSWASVAAAFVGGGIGSRWGLQGLLWGVAAAGVANIALSLPLIVRHLR